MNYGTAEYYKEQFADILADVDAAQSSYAENIFNGFLYAVEDWMTYHADQVDAYSKLRERIRQALAM